MQKFKRMKSYEAEASYHRNSRCSYPVDGHFYGSSPVEPEFCSEGAILIQYKGKTSYVQPDQLSPVDVSGTIINGKGKEKKIQGKGVSVSKLAPGSFDLAVVTAEDEYSASVPAEDAEQAWILINEDGSYRLIVFGDGKRETGC